MSKTVKLIYEELEEHLSSTKDFGNNVIDKTYLEYRISLFKIILFSLLQKKIKCLRNNTDLNAKKVKDIMGIYNESIESLNKSLFGFKFEKFNIELTKDVKPNITKKKNPFKYLSESLKEYKINDDEFDDNVEYKHVSGLLVFIIFHKTKTKEDLSINILSETKTMTGSSMLENITEIILSNNSSLLRELNNIVIHLEEKLKKGIIKELKIKESFKNVESDLFYGFLATLTLNKENKDDVNDVYDYLYNYKKDCKLFIKLYYEIYQYKTGSQNYVYKDIDSATLTSQYNYLLNSETIKKKPEDFMNTEKKYLCLENKQIQFHFYNIIKPIVNNNQSYNIENSVNEIKIDISCNYKKKREKNIKLLPKEILYNNIDFNKEIIIYNNRYIVPEYVFYDKDIILKNGLFNIIQDKYVLTNNNILFKKKTELKYYGLNLLFKINQTFLPWNEFYYFLKNNGDKEKETPEDIYNLLILFKKHNDKAATLIFNNLINNSLTNIFNDIYKNDFKKNINTFQEFCKKYISFNNDNIYKNNSEDCKTFLEQKESFKDILFIFEILFLLIKNV